MAVPSSKSGRRTELQLTKLWRDQNREISPGRTKVWTEPPNDKFKPPGSRVPVVYYLSRNGQLEHPHFIEVSLSSPHGLFLRDVVSRLDILRGKGMAAMYSWSCKRSYKNGFVWHDLSEDDFIYPAHGHEYVLKGSELPDNSLPVTKEQPRPPPSPQENRDCSSDRRRRNQSCSSIDFNLLTEYSVYKAEPADASTQTDDARQRRSRPAPEIVAKENCSKQPQRDEIEMSISPTPSDSSPETLETLMKSESDRRLSPCHETVNERSTCNNNKSSMLMQLISCGSISFKDCGAGNGGRMGLISQYKMRVPRGRVKVTEEKEYFSGSLVETKKEEFPTLKRSTSYNADRL